MDKGLKLDAIMREIGFKLLVFDYTPNLTIVGGYHAINDEDKRTLDEVISQKEFVAVEGDDIHGKNRRISIVKAKKGEKEGYDAAKGVLYSSPINEKFLKAFFKGLDKSREWNISGSHPIWLAILLLGLGQAKIISKSELVSMPERDRGENELTYAQDTAQKLGKDLYQVDIPIYVTIESLISLSPLEKIKAVVAPHTNFISPKLEEVFDKRREQYMMEDIERREGFPLSQLRRKGVLVTGMSHALNYFNQVRQREQV